MCQAYTVCADAAAYFVVYYTLISFVYEFYPKTEPTNDRATE